MPEYLNLNEPRLTQSELALFKTPPALLELMARDPEVDDHVKGSYMRAAIDVLTKLLSRQGMKMMFEGEAIALLHANHPKPLRIDMVFWDLDNFKKINDLSYDAGDEAILCAGIHFRTPLKRKGDIVARLGGDEFAAIFFGANDEVVKEYVRACELLMAQDKTMRFGEIQLTASPGVRTLEIRNPDEIAPVFATLRTQSNDAMHDEKRRRKDAGFVSR